MSIDGLVNFFNTYNYIGGVQFPSHELCSYELSCAWFVLVACILTWVALAQEATLDIFAENMVLNIPF